MEHITMSNRPPVREILESEIRKAGGDENKGKNRAGQIYEELLDTKEGTKDPTVRTDQVDLQEAWHAWFPYGDYRKWDARTIAEATYKSGFSYLFDKLVSEVMIAKYNYGLGNVFNLVQQVNSTHETEDIVGVTAMEGLIETKEGEPVALTTFKEKRAQIANRTYERSVELHRNMVIYDHLNQIIPIAEAIGEKTGNWLHKFIIQKATSQACTATGEAANKSLIYGGTSRTMYANDHSSWDSYANDNLITRVVSTQAMDEMWTLLYLMRDNVGDYINPGTDLKLLCHPTRWKKWERYFSGQYQGDSGNRAPNVYSGAFEIIPTPYVDGAQYFYLGAFAKQTVWQWVQKTAVTRLGDQTQKAFDTGIVRQIKIGLTGGCGTTDYKFVVQSDGTVDADE